MTRKFKTADYEKTLDLQISMREAIGPGHLVRFIVEVIAQLDLSKLYESYARLGAPPYAPEVLLGLLFCGYATGVFSSRKLEQATYEVLPFRFVSGDMHPDHATIAAFRKQYLAELKELFVQILLNFLDLYCDFSGRLLASSFSWSQTLSTPAHTQVTQTVRRLRTWKDNPACIKQRIYLEHYSTKEYSTPSPPTMKTIHASWPLQFLVHLAGVIGMATPILILTW